MSRKRVNEHWCTPADYVASVRRAFAGRIALDPCSNPWSVVQAECEWLLPHSDGLERAWDYSSVFVHPPFCPDEARGMAVDRWLAKCAGARRRHGAEVIALVPAAVTSAAWQRHVWPEARSLCLITASHIPFGEGGRERRPGVAASCAMVYWGEDPVRFEQSVAQHGIVIDLEGIVTSRRDGLRDFSMLRPLRAPGRF